MLTAPPDGSSPRKDARRKAPRAVRKARTSFISRACFLASLLASLSFHGAHAGRARAATFLAPTEGQTEGTSAAPRPVPTLSPEAAAAVTDDRETRLPTRPAPKPLDPAPVKTQPVGHMDLSHEDQLGLSILPGVGYRMIVPYKERQHCGQLDKRVCTGRIPWFIDLEPSYGLSRGWDLLVTLRFGIEKDFHTHRQFAAMPGFRYWADRDTALRLYTTLQLVYDQTDQNQPGVANTDFGFRNSTGFMYDIIRNFSLFFQFGETLGFSRWFRFEMDGGFGAQIRVP